MTQNGTSWARAARRAGSEVRALDLDEAVGNVKEEAEQLGDNLDLTTDTTSLGLAGVFQKAGLEQGPPAHRTESEAPSVGGASR